MTDRIDDVLDLALSRLAAGESLDSVLAAYPDHAPELRALLAPLATVLDAPVPEPARLSRERALQSTLDRASNAGRLAPASGASTGWSWLTSFQRRPARFQGVAVLAAAVLFGGVAIGASAASGEGLSPGRTLFSSASSLTEMEFSGTVTAVEPAALFVDDDGTSRHVRVTEDTRLRRSGDEFAFAELRPGDEVEVNGRLQPDGSVLATRIQLEDDEADDATAVPTTSAPEPTSPSAVPTVDSRDNSGPGNGDDQDDDEEDDGNSGPGNGEDDEDDGPGDDGGDDGGDNSGPGNSDDRDDDEDGDNSGPGSGDSGGGDHGEDDDGGGSDGGDRGDDD